MNLSMGSTRFPRVGFGVTPKPRPTIQSPGGIGMTGDYSRIRGNNGGTNVAGGTPATTRGTRVLPNACFPEKGTRFGDIQFL